MTEKHQGTASLVKGHWQFTDSFEEPTELTSGRGEWGLQPGSSPRPVQGIGRLRGGGPARGHWQLARLSSARTQPWSRLQGEGLWVQRSCSGCCSLTHTSSHRCHPRTCFFPTWLLHFRLSKIKKSLNYWKRKYIYFTVPGGFILNTPLCCHWEKEASFNSKKQKLNGWGQNKHKSSQPKSQSKFLGPSHWCVTQKQSGSQRTSALHWCSVGYNVDCVTGDSRHGHAG